MGPASGFLTHGSIHNKARCKFFDTLLSGGFIEEGKQEVQIPDSEPHLFRLMLEYLYTNNIEGLGPHVSDWIFFFIPLRQCGCGTLCETFCSSFYVLLLLRHELTLRP